jgi:hypothetical protein
MPTNHPQLWRQRLEEARQPLLTLLASLTPTQWETTVYHDGEPWSVATIVSHLIDSERGMSVHVHKTRKGEPTVPEGFDIHRWNAGVKTRVGNLSPGELLDALVATRSKTLSVLDSLQPEDWGRVGRHPTRGMITIEQYYETVEQHDRLHRQDIQTALVKS